MAQLGFDLQEVEVSSGSFELLPPGEYTLSCIDADIKDTKRGDGQYIAASFTVVGKPGRIWHNFNVHNPNSKAEEIGRQQLASWARACGKPNARDTDELIERQFNAKIDIEHSVGYADKNVIKLFLFKAQTSDSASTQVAGKPSVAASDNHKPAAKVAPAPAPAAAKATGNPWD